MGALNKFRIRAVGRVHRIFDRRFDARYGIETVANVDAVDVTDEVDLAGYESDEEMYAGTPSLIFAGLHAPLSEVDRAKTTYVDIGCGKGRMLIQASQAGFASVIGVEFAASLAQTARENLRAALGPDTENMRWRIDNDDARTYRYPDGDIVLFLYNPFDAPIFKVFVDNLLADLQERPRALHIIYNNPKCANMLDAAPAFERMAYQGANKTYLRFSNPHAFGAWRYVGVQ